MTIKVEHVSIPLEVITAVLLWEIVVNIPVLQKIPSMQFISLGFNDAVLHWLLSNNPISSGGGGDYFVHYYYVELNWNS